MLINDGIITPEELKVALPPEERYKKGPVAIIECLQDIPCDPCVYACPVKAIQMKEGITDRPVLDFDKCTGCGLCVPKCPGLAIFIVNKNIAPGKASISMSHELLPIPVKDQIVTLLDRSGKAVGEGKVLKVMNPPHYDKTVVVTVEVPEDKVMDVRAIRVTSGGMK
ncbi:MAG: 4Fe-4S dicluster domain-containing protein [Candidatus Rifleibacteriota bacterium]